MRGVERIWNDFGKFRSIVHVEKLSFIEESLVILEDGNYSLFTGSFLDTGNSIFYDDSSGESFYRFSIDEIQAARNSHL